MDNFNIIDYFSSGRKEYWLEKIGKCDWSGGRFLYSLIESGKLFETLGERTRVLLLTDGDELVSFCTFAEKDDIQPTELSPWIGFVYTFPERRGGRCVGRLFDEIARLARAENIDKAYISTNHIGLYEKYGCEFFKEMTDIGGEISRVYVKRFD